MIVIRFAIIYFIIFSFSYLLTYLPSFRSVLPQITYGNMALIFLSYFHGYNKNEIFEDHWDHWDTLNVFKCCHI
jgi:hypothetical protein